MLTNFFMAYVGLNMPTIMKPGCQKKNFSLFFIQAKIPTYFPYPLDHKVGVMEIMENQILG